MSFNMVGNCFTIPPRGFGTDPTKDQVPPPAASLADPKTLIVGGVLVVGVVWAVWFLRNS